MNIDFKDDVIVKEFDIHLGKQFLDSGMKQPFKALDG